LLGGVVRGEAAELAWYQRKANVLAAQYGSAAAHRARTLTAAGAAAAAEAASVDATNLPAA
jgi:hypothetical protein